MAHTLNQIEIIDICTHKRAPRRPAAAKQLGRWFVAFLAAASSLLLGAACNSTSGVIGVGVDADMDGEAQHTDGGRLAVDAATDDAGDGLRDATVDAPSSDADVAAIDGATIRSTGCGTAATPGTTLRHVVVDAVDRTFTVVIPDAYDPTVPHSMVFRFHGFGATGAASVGGVGLTIPHIMIGPDTDPPTGTTVAWNTSRDLAFVDAMVDTLTRELCVDESRNFVTGYSNGGFMAHAVGCHRSRTFRGVGIQESGSSGGGCEPIATFILHNSDDMTVPISYGTTLRDQVIITNGCSDTFHAVPPDPCVAYDGCSPGHPVVWCNPAAGGHRPDYGISLAMGPFFESL